MFAILAERMSPFLLKDRLTNTSAEGRDTRLSRLFGTYQHDLEDYPRSKDAEKGSECGVA